MEPLHIPFPMQRSTKSSSPTSAAEEVAGCRDTLSEILLRLPPKPLLRFKSVSKQWLSLISDPKFSHSHTLRHTPPRALLLASHAPSLHFNLIPLTATPMARALNFNFLNHPHVSVLRSTNGLLLCRSDSDYFICNPTTRKFVTLTFPTKQLKNLIHGLYLAFDPLRSPHYQVISVRRRGPQQGVWLSEFNVFSSNSGSWDEPGVCHTAPANEITCPGVYFNGAIHWCNNDCRSLLYFDIGARCLKNLPSPGEVRVSQSVEYFGESGGRLHLILGKRTLEFDILELKDDYSGWLMRHCVDLNPMQVEYPDLCWSLANYVLPFYIRCGANEEDSVLVLLLGGTAISYDPVTFTSRKLCDFKMDMTMVVAGYMSGQVFQYFESLSLVEAFTASC